jgi:hypothetical protein
MAAPAMPHSRAPPPLPFPFPLSPICDEHPHGRPWSTKSGNGCSPMESSNQGHFSLWDNQNGYTRPPSCYPPSILSEMNSNLRILRDFVFQLNSDFISNSNLNPFRLLLGPYISLGAPPPRFPISILPQNQILAATQLPPRRQCLSLPPHLFQSPPFKLNPVLVVRSHGPNHRRKNHI